MRIGLCWISLTACTLILTTILCTEVTNPISMKAITTLPHDLSREDINASALAPYLELLDPKALQERSEKALSEEFMALERLCSQKKHINNLYHSAEVAKHNRYKDILPFKHNRVLLEGPEEPVTYINANFISNPYTGDRKVFIATQGPVPRSFNNFWRMVWQEKVNKVVMLCSFTEGERSACDKYWPENHNSLIQAIKIDHFTITLESVENPNAFLTVRKLRLVDDRNNEMRMVTQIHTTGWPDKSIPDDSNLFHLLGLVNNLKAAEEKAPVVVHCSAGIGRTGTFMSLYFLSWLLEEQTRIGQSPRLSVFGTVRNLKEQRYGSVETFQQYKFIYKIAALLSASQNSTDL